MASKRDRSHERGSKLEQHVGERLAALRAKLDEQVQIMPQYPVTLASGRRALIDFRLTIHFSHETQNYYIEVQSRRKHDHELIDKIEAVRRDTELKTFRFIHDTPLEESVANELKSRGVICYDLEGLDKFLVGIELNLTAVARLQEQVDRGDKSVDAELRALVHEIASAEKDIAHVRPAASPRRDKLIKDAVELASRNPGAAIRVLKDLFGGR